MLARNRILRQYTVPAGAFGDWPSSLYFTAHSYNVDGYEGYNHRYPYCCCYGTCSLHVAKAAPTRRRFVVSGAEGLRNTASRLHSGTVEPTPTRALPPRALYAGLSENYAQSDDLYAWLSG
ncbi:hypothetical protein HPB52_017208 [Rhipicephalus sanguineus]|uniref:Uncharacterized protein n=1 Tax=Rhipicephalus sanguineus TaxID=34632 RepID=A0A9D4PQI4_RHISA|nr:hypothetical protein HPB52_017208 [Rhipicephalus sanguineus]